jgi:outer membrane protein assembly factor BamD
MPVLFALGCAATGASHKPGATPEDDYAAARREFEAGHMYDAVLLLTEFIDKHPGSVLVDQAIFTLGLAHQAQKDWVLAATEFERLVRDFPESRSACDAEFALGECYWRESRKPNYDQHETQQAIDQFKRYLTRCPDDSRRAAAESLIAVARDKLAKKQLGNAELYARMHDREPALVYCDLVLSDFGDTRWVCDARALRALLLAEMGRRDEVRAEIEWLRERCVHAPKVMERVEKLEGEIGAPEGGEIGAPKEGS